MASRLQVVGTQDDPVHRTIFNAATGNFLRMGPLEWSLLTELDGTTTPAALAERRALPVADVTRLLEHFDQLGLVDGPERAAASRARPKASRIVWEIDGRLVAQRLNPLAGAFGFPAVVAIALLTAVAAVVAAVGADRTVGLVQSHPNAVTLLAVGAAVLPMVVLHELAHAASLIRFGGVPGRIGIRLRGGVPTPFCDISDGWRLESRRQRTTVAAAGILVNCLLSSVFFLAGMALAGTEGLAQGLLLFAGLNLVCAVACAVPFGRSDGYWALSLALDVPNLRERSVTYAQGRVLAALTRQPAAAAPSPRSRLWLAYGLSTLLLPLLSRASIVATAPLFLHFGRVGALTWLVLAGVGIVTAARRLPPAAHLVRPFFARPLARGVAIVTFLAVAGLVHLVPVAGPLTSGDCRTIDGCVVDATVRPILQEIKSP